MDLPPTGKQVQVQELHIFRLVNGQIGYHLTPRVHVVMDVFNVLNSRASDIDYFYASRLPGEPLGGVDDIHAHPTLPRTARLVLRIQF